ncbi:NAD synthetase [Achromatium sp. WMS2]|nr:NAD synthetase [Achromatium sp. WMS2]
MSIKIVLAQVNLLVGDIAGNTNLVLHHAIRACKDYQGHIIIFPELTLTGYPPEDLLLRPELHQRIEQALDKLLAAKLDIAIILGYPRQYAAKLYNCAGVIYNGKILAEYRKQALPNYGVFDEQRYFHQGTQPGLCTIANIPLALTICEDIWLSQPAQQAKAAGAKLLININASPFNVGKAAIRENNVRQRVHETNLPIIYLNLVGGQDELVFDGNSFVMDADGTIVQRGPHCLNSDMLLEITTPASNTDTAITNQSLILKPVSAPDIPRNNNYVKQDVEFIYQAIVLGIQDYVTKNGFKGAILGLSGGIDSALTLALAVDALGPANVEAVLMPSPYTAAMSNEDAVAEAQALGVIWHTIAIESVFQNFLDLLAPSFVGYPADVTEENIQARCRGIILMALSNKTGKILLTTGNKSELSVGYATLYGDMAGGFAPIKDVFKTMVYQLAEYRNSIAAVIPKRVLERPPSAELRPNQTDQDSLPDYPTLDLILQLYVEQDQSVTDIVNATKFAPEMVYQVTRLVDRSEYKRRQAPPGVRITSRAFGRDRRYPLTNGFNLTPNLT